MSYHWSYYCSLIYCINKILRRIQGDFFTVLHFVKRFVWDCLVFTEYSYYCEFFFLRPVLRLCNCHCHGWVSYIDTTKITVCCMSPLILSIDLWWLYYFIMIHFKLTNGAMVKWWMMKWCNGERKIRIGRFFLTTIEYVHLFYFQTQKICSRSRNHNLQFLITNNKYNNQVYVIKPIYHLKTGLYQGSANCCEWDRESDLNSLASEISGNTLL